MLGSYRVVTGLYVIVLYIYLDSYSSIEIRRTPLCHNWDIKVSYKIRPNKRWEAFVWSYFQMGGWRSGRSVYAICDYIHMCSALGLGCRRPSDVVMHTESPSPTVGITRDRRGSLQPYTNGTRYKWIGFSTGICLKVDGWPGRAGRTLPGSAINGRTGLGGTQKSCVVLPVRWQGGYVQEAREALRRVRARNSASVAVSYIT